MLIESTIWARLVFRKERKAILLLRFPGICFQINSQRIVSEGLWVLSSVFFPQTCELGSIRPA